MPDLYATSNTADAGFDAAVIAYYASVGCCALGYENIRQALQQNGRWVITPSGVLKTSCMVIGLGLGIYCDVLATPEMYEAICNYFEENTEAADWSIKFFAGMMNALVDIFLPFTGFNIAGWAVRGIEKAGQKFFSSNIPNPFTWFKEALPCSRENSSSFTFKP